MKKILQIVGKLYIGGAEKVARDIGLHGMEAGYQIDYVVFGDEIGAYEPELLEKGCRIFHLPPPSQGYRDYVAALRKLVGENGYQGIHCHTMFSSGWAMLVGRQLGVPVRIAHSHSIRGFERRNWLKNTYEKTMRRVILKNATHCIACGQQAGNWLFGEKDFARRGKVILNGIDTRRFAYNEEHRRAVRQELDLRDAFVIGHVGHLAAVKNQSFLLELLPKLLEKRPNARLLLLGEGNDRPMLEEKIRRLGMEDSAILTGNVPDVHRYLSAMDVFAFPSRYEGMPLSIVEVQANGLPCVISDRVPKDVFLTDLIHPLPLEDPAAWVETLLGVGRQDPARYGPVLGETGFDTAQMLRQIYELYDTVP